jgi:nicotinamide mononucleotide transporter
MMFAGLFFWKRNLKEDVQEIVKTRLTGRARLIYGLITAAAVAAGAGILALLHDPMPVVDSITTVLSVAAMILTVKRCSEQWFLWTVVNVVSIYMWYRVYQTGEGSAAVLMMWILSLINGIMFYCLWQREIKKCAKKI